MESEERLEAYYFLQIHTVFTEISCEKEQLPLQVQYYLPAQYETKSSSL